MPDATILPMPPGEGPRPATGFTLITGLSGAGRSEAAHSLEDLGFFVVDNLPPALLGKMAELVSRPGGPTRVAIVVDARGGVFFGELSKALEELKQEHVDYRIVFLEAADDDLVNRYEATRRRHPLAPADRVVEGIRKERLMMESLRGDADLIIDTSGLTPHGLRDRIREAFADAPPESGLQVSIQSFGFKYGSPRDADLVFDVRFLPNPHWVEELRPLPGTEQPRSRLRARPAAIRGVHGAARGVARRRGAGLRRRGQVLPHRRGGLHRRPAPLRGRGRRARRVPVRARHAGQRHAPRPAPSLRPPGTTPRSAR